MDGAGSGVGDALVGLGGRRWKGCVGRKENYAGKVEASGSGDWLVICPIWGCRHRWRIGRECG